MASSGPAEASVAALVATVAVPALVAFVHRGSLSLAQRFLFAGFTTSSSSVLAAILLPDPWDVVAAVLATFVSIALIAAAFVAFRRAGARVRRR